LPIQLAAAKALELPGSWYSDLNAIYAKRRAHVFALLDLIDCTYDRAQAGMFVWAQVPATTASGYSLSDDLLDKARVFITPGGIFGEGGNGYVRVSLCCSEEKLQQSIVRIKEIRENKNLADV
jgi:LL-diaminopimelate aminotransferase